jgi:hypothetical protein
MTAQILDSMEYLGCEFDIAGIHGGPLFEPLSYGLNPRFISTACWRGFFCTYSVDDEGLYLKQLHIGGGGQELLGIRPVRENGFNAFVFKRLRLGVSFTGGLLLGRGSIQHRYECFHPAWGYREVLELLFEEGRLRRTLDCSKPLAELREQLKRGPLHPGSSNSREEVDAWVARCFSLKYDRG